MYQFTLQRARFTVGVGRSQSDTRNARCAKFNATEENYDFVLGGAECVPAALVINAIKSARPQRLRLQAERIVQAAQIAKQAADAAQIEQQLAEAALSVRLEAESDPRSGGVEDADRLHHHAAIGAWTVPLAWEWLWSVRHQMCPGRSEAEFNNSDVVKLWKRVEANIKYAR